jgi:zinc transporter, ZIP family
MTFPKLLLLGVVAGLPIFLGLPIARLKRPATRMRTLLNGFSAGVLLFLLVEILHEATEPLEEKVEGVAEGHGSWLELGAFGVVYTLGLAAGMLSLVYITRIRRRRVPLVVAETGVAPQPKDSRQEALSLGMLVSGAIGLHNFSEGLAIGQSADAGRISLALLLVIGFALHNATEGFGIVGPLAAAGVQPSWRWLAGAGLLGGGPTLAGTLVGSSLSSRYLFVAFLTLAAGGIIYVVGEMFATGRRLSWQTTLFGILLGFVFAAATELVLVAAGA